MTRWSSALPVLFLVAVLAASAYVSLRFQIATDVTAFFPEGGDPLVAEVARRMTDSELARTMVLMIAAQDPAKTPAAGMAFEQALRRQPAIAKGLEFLHGGPDLGGEQAIYELYHPRRFLFAADSPRQARDLLADAALRKSAQALRKRLSEPMSPLLSRLATSDPLLIVAKFFENLQTSEGRSLKVSEGRFVTTDSRWSVLFFATKARAFDSAAQEPIVASVERAFAEVNRKFSGTLVLEQSSIQRVAVRTEQAIKKDIQRVSTLSTISLLVVLLALFRSLRLAALAAIPIAAGIVAGLASCLLVYGRVHGITLAFGASLIGVAIDYVVHLYCHHAVVPSASGPRGTLASIAPSLLTGAVTTLAGFVALAFAGFPGLQEVSLFASTGIVTALFATCLWLPSLLPTVMEDVPMRTALVDALMWLFANLRQHRRPLQGLLVGAVLFAGAGLSQVSLRTDLLHMAQVDAGLAAEDSRVRLRVARFDQTRLIVAMGPNEEAALQSNDHLAEALHAAVGAGELGSFRNVATLLPSASHQQAVASAVRAQLGDGSRLVQVFEAEGFRGAALTPFLKSLHERDPAPLTYADLLHSPLAAAVRSFHVTLGNQVAFVTFLHDVHDVAALRKRLKPLANVTFVDQGQQLRETYQAYQTKTAELIALGLVAVLLLVVARYRTMRSVLAAFGPALLAALVTVSTLHFLGYNLDLVSLTALLMVVSMGVDYGVFLVDAERIGTDHARAALLSVVMAALSTVLGFGLLALSDHPMLAAIGITAWVGVLSCLLLAPTALILTSRIPEYNSSGKIS